ncbi:MAG: hypothetical protein HC842_09840 [Cytophagales bacterium]|nr:hypothetical protein [Cytophagales bacterium]
MASSTGIDRNCTFRPNDACATVEVAPGGQFLIDPCCNSTFDFSGIPTSGPSRRNLIQYNTTRSGSLLYVEN